MSSSPRSYPFPSSAQAGRLYPHLRPEPVVGRGNSPMQEVSGVLEGQIVGIFGRRHDGWRLGIIGSRLRISSAISVCTR